MGVDEELGPEASDAFAVARMAVLSVQARTVARWSTILCALGAAGCAAAVAAGATHAGTACGAVAIATAPLAGGALALARVAHGCARRGVRASRLCHAGLLALTSAFLAACVVLATCTRFAPGIAGGDAASVWGTRAALALCSLVAVATAGRAVREARAPVSTLADASRL